MGREGLRLVLVMAALLGESCLDRELTSAQLYKLDGRAGVQVGHTYAGTIYNGNENLTVNSVDILLTSTQSGGTTSHLYRVELKIPPMSAAEFSFPIIVGDFGATYTWRIQTARGGP